MDNRGRLIQDEEREKGSVSKDILQVASNYWMAWASPSSTTTESAMLHSVLRAPMSFFDSTPSGRILNRASTDQSVLDLELAANLAWCAFSVIQILGTIAVMSQQYYIPTARELARLSEIQRSPILHHFAESFSGATTIRAFGQKDRFSNTNLDLIDNYSRTWFHEFSAVEWLSFRLDLLSNFVFAFSLILLVNLPEGFFSPSVAGLAVTYGLNLNSQLATIIWFICNIETTMISVERILQYSRIPSEAPVLIEGCRPPTNWPQVGTICFKNLEVRYAEHLPSVLKNITCTVPGRKQVGIVGRTGSGKSTLIQALFRIVEPREGTIQIDDGTVRGNLDPFEEYSDSRIWEASFFFKPKIFII
ncbi:hypothetical protein B296_00000778 [Ensete ventricosum]|uniref:ABC transmembrane type-1 domain-containing protein n=1 Tax=Ensete ventricosum TaxID=4639 RepID=A0A427B993_ENSVE|nr:hypothetical protein B296_00000778 [Ensete ventricosum]